MQLLQGRRKQQNFIQIIISLSAQKVNIYNNRVTNRPSTTQMELEMTDTHNHPQMHAIESKAKQQMTTEGNISHFKFTIDGLPSIIAKKVEGIVDLLNSDIIDIDRLKIYLAEGIPDEAPVIREYAWKLILGFLPEERSKWQEKVDKDNKTYEGLVKMFLPDQNFEGYPLILKNTHPRYKELEKDYLIWQQIQKDTSRTHAEFTFFAMQSKEIMLPYLTSARRQKFKLIYGEEEAAYQEFLKDKDLQKKTYRYDYMTRILYIYSKLNPKIQYVQGMNQILAPIFYLVNITKPANAVEEGSCFFMFNNAISDIIELHIKDFDKSKNGIYGKLNDFNDMLVVIDPDIWARLNRLKIDPFFYCFRWVTLLYAQDFPLFDTLRLWEVIFSKEDRMQFISFLAIAIILSCKEIIIKCEFTVIMAYLQNVKDHIKISSAIQIANQLYSQHENEEFGQTAAQIKKDIEKKEKERRRELRKLKEQEVKNKEKIEHQTEEKAVEQSVKVQQQFKQEMVEEKGESAGKRILSKLSNLMQKYF